MLNLVRGGPSPRYKLAGTRQGSRRTWARSVSFAWRSLPCSIETAILFATCSEWGFSSRSYGGKPAHLSSRERSDLRPLAGESLLLSLASESGIHTPPHLHFAKERHSWLEFGSSSLQVGQKQFDGDLTDAAAELRRFGAVYKGMNCEIRRASDCDHRKGQTTSRGLTDHVW